MRIDSLNLISCADVFSSSLPGIRTVSWARRVDVDEKKKNKKTMAGTKALSDIFRSESSTKATSYKALTCS